MMMDDKQQASRKAVPHYLRSKTKGERFFDVVNILFLTLLTFTFIYPFLNMIAISLSGNTYVLRGEVSFYPKGWSLASYEMVFANKALWSAYLNTITIAGLGCLSSLLALSLTAYPLAFSDFYGKKIFSFMVLFTLWFSGGMIPTFLVVRAVGLLDTKWALVLNLLISAYYVIIVRSYFQGIPMSLIESARIDGGNDFRILFGVVIPLSKPVLATIALWIIVAHWNDYFYPLMFIRKFENQTLQMVLKDIVLKADAIMYDMSSSTELDEIGAVSEQIKNAVLFVSLIPMLAIYPFLQKYFVGGVMLGAVKE